MSDRHRIYHDFIDIPALKAEHPIGEDFLRFARTISQDALRARQQALLNRVLDRAWGMEFYRRLWGAGGAERGDIKTFEDLSKLPCFGKAEIVASIERAPPFGDFAGWDSYPPGQAPPAIFHTTSGTTGKPQPLIFGPRTREVQNLLLGRALRFQGLQPDDVVHSVYGHGLINGGHYVREAVTHWTGAMFMPAGTGIETRSAAQVQLMADFGASVILGFADYIKKLAETAAEQGLELGRDLRIRMISGHFGREDKEAVSALWGGAQCFDWYGVGDTGLIAAEGPDRNGLYVMEDAHWIEICDLDTGAPVAPGEKGDLIVTCLFKDDLYPIVRFNTHDVTREMLGSSALGWGLKRIEGFLGRSDNMVKLRGVNVFPQAIGPILAELSSYRGEYVCRARRDEAGRDHLVVIAEAEGGELAAYQEILRRRLGVEVEVEFVAPGATAPFTKVHERQKPIRLIDERGKPA